MYGAGNYYDSRCRRNCFAAILSDGIAYWYIHTPRPKKLALRPCLVPTAVVFLGSAGFVSPRPHQQQCWSNIRHCRKNRSTCSVRQRCLDIVVGVDEAELKGVKGFDPPRRQSWPPSPTEDWKEHVVNLCTDSSRVFWYSVPVYVCYSLSQRRIVN